MFLVCALWRQGTLFLGTGCSLYAQTQHFLYFYISYRIVTFSQLKYKKPYNIDSILINKLFLYIAFYLNSILILLKQIFAKPIKFVTQMYGPRFFSPS